MNTLDTKETKIITQISEIEARISKCKDIILSYEKRKAKLEAILEEKRVKELGDYNPISSVEQLVKVLNFCDKNSFCWKNGDPAINGTMLRLLEASITRGYEAHILINKHGNLVCKFTKDGKKI